MGEAASQLDICHDAPDSIGKAGSIIRIADPHNVDAVCELIPKEKLVIDFSTDEERATAGKNFPRHLRSMKFDRKPVF
jgi:hypothetical protein